MNAKQNHASKRAPSPSVSQLRGPVDPSGKVSRRDKRQAAASCVSCRTAVPPAGSPGLAHGPGLPPPNDEDAWRVDAEAAHPHAGPSGLASSPSALCEGADTGGALLVIYPYLRPSIGISPAILFTLGESSFHGPRESPSGRIHASAYGPLLFSDLHERNLGQAIQVYSPHPC